MIVTVASAELVEPSLTRYRNVSTPWKLAAGVYEKLPLAFTTALPCPAFEVRLAVTRTAFGVRII